jgi:hypothetical protein
MTGTALGVLLVLLVWAAAIAPPAFATEKMSATTFLNTGNEREIFVFRIGEEEDGQLYARHFDGTNWIWVPHGLPAGVFRVHNPTALNYLDANGNRRVYVFVQGDDGKLWLRYFNGFQWQWQARGGPTLVDNSLSAITYVDGAGNQRLYAFAMTKIGSQNYLVSNYWNGSAWQWVTHGSVFGPESRTVSITYPDVAGNRHIDVFLQGGTNSGLYSFSWNGSDWNWINHGHDDVWPLSATTYLHGHDDVWPLSATTYLDDQGQRRVYLFVKEGNTLAVRYTGGAAWNWRYLETTSLPLNDVSAVPFVDTLGLRRMMVFIQLGGSLFASSWNGLFWAPAQLNTPVPASRPRAIAYRDSRNAVDHVTVFASCTLGGGTSLCSNSTTTGLGWQLMDHGVPP